jgi:DNA-binding FadR family transcriptional regulator
LILSAAKSNEKSIEDLVLDVKAPRPVIQAAIQELASLGLILPSQGNGFEFRDLATAQAIKQLGDLSLES